MTSILIDLAIIGVVVYCTWRGYKNGLIRGVFGVVALVVAILAANIIANAYSEEFEGMLIPFVGGVIDTALADIDSDNVPFEDIDHEDDSEDFRASYTALREIGLPIPAAISVTERAIVGDSERSLSTSIADTLSSSLAYIAVFAIAFVLITIVFAVIGNLIGFVFSLPGLRLVDAITGTAFGFVKGLIIVLTLAVVARYFGLLAIELLEDTVVLNYLVQNNFIAGILGI
ncbi:MAG: CvpA family protein [Oscillospiraceae bacterium]|nr:CvpA family protein [Oscillospiraceae bacterium]